MAQNITLMGASYSDVPAVNLPKTGGGTARFTDATVTTATEADVTQGKVFIKADGSTATGTASGGGGASNFVSGTFTTGSTTGTTQTVTIPYTGSGYPVAVMVYIEGGVYNNTSTGDTNWYNSVQRYAIGEWFMSKSNTTLSPTYTTSGAANQGATMWVFKNSTSAATTYSRSSAMNTNSYSSSNATGAGATAVRIRNATTLSVYIASTSYGLLADTTYRYHIVYSE